LSYSPEILDKLKALCAAAGVRFFGVVSLGPEKDFARFDQWLESNSHAGMAYLEKYKHCRADPRELLEGAKTAIIIGLNYYLGDVYTSKKRRPELPRIAQYARLKDYHRILWQRGAEVSQQLLALLGEKESESQHASRVVVDSAPLLERALAARGGQGFIGKNTCFIDPAAGSFYLLGEVVTTLELPITMGEPVDPHSRGIKGGCGTCQRCQVHCPTGALDQAYHLDANKCLSYWTIENRGVIPERFWPWLGHYVFGCDICQLVCPYNRGAIARPDDELLRIKVAPDLFDVATMTPLSYESMFAGTPVTRAKREGLIRNALIAMCVTHDKRLGRAMEVVREHEKDPMLHDTLAQLDVWRAKESVTK
jgi:epoxyqueuosine reductase